MRLSRRKHIMYYTQLVITYRIMNIHPLVFARMFHKLGIQNITTPGRYIYRVYSSKQKGRVCTAVLTPRIYTRGNINSQVVTANCNNIVQIKTLVAVSTVTNIAVAFFCKKNEFQKTVHVLVVYTLQGRCICSVITSAYFLCLLLRLIC